MDKTLHVFFSEGTNSTFASLMEPISYGSYEILDYASLFLWTLQSKEIHISSYVKSENTVNKEIAKKEVFCSKDNVVKEFAIWFDRQYNNFINISNVGQNYLYVCLWVPLWENNQVQDALNILSAIDKSNNKCLVDIIGLASDLFPVLNPSMTEKELSENIASIEKISSDNCKKIQFYCKDILSSRNFIILQNRQIENKSLNLSRDQFSKLLSEFLAVYTERNIEVFGLQRSGDVFGVGISVLNFDRSFFIEKLFAKSCLYMMEREGVNKDDADIAKLKNVVNRSLKEATGGESKLLSHFWHKYIAEQLSSKDSPERIVSGVKDNIDKYLSTISDNVLAFIKAESFSLPEKRAGIASLLGEDDDLFKGIDYDSSLPIWEDCEVEPAQLFVDYNNDIVANVSTIEGLNEAEAALSTIQNTNEKIDLHVDELKNLKQQIRSSIQEIRRLHDEIDRQNKEIEDTLVADKVEIQDGYFVVRGASYRISPKPFDDQKLNDVYQISGENISQAFSLKGAMPPIRNQGQIGSCTAHSVVAAYEYCAHRIEKSYYLDLSEMFVYYKAREYTNTQNEDNGASLFFAMKSMQEHGACLASNWDAVSVEERPTDEAIQSAKDNMVVKAQSVEHNIDHIKDAIAHGYPVTIALKIYPSFSRCGITKGFVMMPTDEEISAGDFGYHAMLLCGYSDKEGVFIVRNSWGEEWGDKGYCYIPYSYIANNELLSPNSTYIIRKITLEEKYGEVNNAVDNTKVHFNVNDAAIQYAISKQRLKEEEIKLHKNEEHYNVVRSLYGSIMTTISDSSIKQTLERGEEKCVKHRVSQCNERVERLRNDLELTKTKFNVGSVQIIGNIVIFCLALLSFAITCKWLGSSIIKEGVELFPNVNSFTLADFISSICYIGIAVCFLSSLLSIYVSLSLNGCKVIDETIFKHIPKSKMVRDLFILSGLLIVVLIVNQVPSMHSFMPQWINIHFPDCEPIGHVFNIASTLSFIMLAIALLFVVVVYGLRNNEMRKITRESEKEIDKAIECLTKEKIALDKLHLKTYVAGLLHDNLYRLKGDFYNIHKVLCSYTYNLKQWYKTIGDNLPSHSLTEQVPYISVIDNNVLDNYFEKNKENITTNLYLRDFIGQYELSEEAISRFRVELQKSVKGRINTILDNFNMYKYITKVEEYPYLPSFDHSSFEDVLSEMDRRSLVFMTFNNSNLDAITPKKFILTNFGDKMPSNSWENGLSNVFLTNRPNVIMCSTTYNLIMVQTLSCKE